MKWNLQIKMLFNTRNSGELLQSTGGVTARSDDSPPIWAWISNGPCSNPAPPLSQSKLASLMQTVDDMSARKSENGVVTEYDQNPYGGSIAAFGS